MSLPAGTVATFYAIGGLDGQASAFEVTRTVSVCGTPGTTAPPTTVAPAAIVAHPATPVVTQPTYTG